MLKLRILMVAFAIGAAPLAVSAGSEVQMDARHHDQIDTAILRAAFFGGIAGNRMIFRIAGSGDSVRLNGLHLDKQPRDARRPHRPRGPSGGARNRALARPGSYFAR